MDNNQNLEALDLLAIISFIAQIENMNEDSKEKEYIHTVIKAIAQQIDKLHKENDRIENKLNEVLKILKGDQ